MRRILCWTNADDANCVARGRCELVCAFTPSDRKIGRTVRSTWVYCYTCVNCPCALLPRSTPKDRKIGRTVSSFEMFYFELLDPEILSAASSILHPFKILHFSANKFTHVPCCRAYNSKSFILSSWILKILTNNTQKHILFRASGSWNFEKLTRRTCLVKRGSEHRPYFSWDTNSVKLLACVFIEGYIKGSQYRTHVK